METWFPHPGDIDFREEIKSALFGVAVGDAVASHRDRVRAIAVHGLGAPRGGRQQQQEEDR